MCSQLYLNTLNSRPTSITEMSSFNNFTGMNFDYSYFEDESKFDSDTQIAGPSRFQDWYPNPVSERYSEQSGYEGYTLLDASGNQFVDPHTMYPVPFDSNEAGELF